MEMTVLSLFREKVKQFRDIAALYYKDKDNQFQPVSFTELFNLAGQFGTGLTAIGIKRGDHIGIISNNRKEWMISSFGIMGIGALDVPRGSDSTAAEIKYILGHAECPVCIVEDKDQLEKVLSVKKGLLKLASFIVLDEDYKKASKKEGGVEVFTFLEILEKGKTILEKDPDFFNKEIDMGKADDLATIIYTSGTTGEPKGVMLTHDNFLHQIRAPLAHLDVRVNDFFLSVLPIWHVFERSAEYVGLFAGCSIIYSKLIGKVILADMETMKPTIFPSVPRIWESVRAGIYKKVNSEGGIKKTLFHFFVSVGTIHVYFLNMMRGLLPEFKKRIRLFDIVISLFPLLVFTPLKLLGDLLVFGQIKKKLGGRFKFGISGAGALPPHIDKFFAAAGIHLFEGYGLTEAAPIVSVRKQKTPVTGTIGPPLPEISVKICDPEGNELPPGKKGILFIKGPNVMQGYYKKPEETKKVLSDDGWLNTGDLAMATYNGELRIMGRVKETIVLLGGENVEPGPIEDTILQSPYIDQVMVVGQDQKYLGVLVIPNFENLEIYARKNGLYYPKSEDLTDLPEIEALIKDEINSKVNIKKGFKAFERIFKLTLLKVPFEAGRELTNTLKLKRDVINNMYKKEIEELFS
ncbi:MAG: AMP-binding protein [Spirochaetales bacterium]|nr:AMP-binding protein [Spirochaetales bacterium]